MAVWPPNPLLALAAISGVTIHVAVYRHGEWDIKAPSIVLAYAVLFLGAALLEYGHKTNAVQMGVSRVPTMRMLASHILGVYGSMVLYRAFFHRLARFPGPFFARLSNFYVTALSARKFHLYEETQRLHKQYGDYIRLGIVLPSSRILLFIPQARLTKEIR